MIIYEHFNGNDFIPTKKYVMGERMFSDLTKLSGSVGTGHRRISGLRTV